MLYTILEPFRGIFSADSAIAVRTRENSGLLNLYGFATNTGIPHLNLDVHAIEGASIIQLIPELA
jgi:hypothetical protein